LEECENSLNKISNNEKVILFYNLVKADQNWRNIRYLVHSESPASSYLLNLLAVIGEIPPTILSKGKGILPDSLRDEPQLDCAYLILKRYSLAYLNGDRISIPRRVQDKIQNDLDRDTKKMWINLAARLINRLRGEYKSIFYNKKGWLLYTLGNYGSAIKYLDEAIKLDPNYGDAWNNKGLILYNLEDFEKAAKCHDNAIMLNPSDANSWYDKSNALKALGRNADAEAAFIKANELLYNTG